MNKLLITAGFALMVMAQWFVPGQMIVNQEKALAEGTPYKFKTRPIDPNDPFRGKYVWLNYDMDKVKTNDSVWSYKQPVYIYITTGKDGFAEASQISKELLDTHQDYVKGEAGYYHDNELSFDLPFDRFYMEESKALDAENGIRRTRLGSRDSLAPVCYALVYVKEDIAVLDNVFIGEDSLKEFVEKEQAERRSKPE